MNKRISRREKVMLGVLCIAAVITAYYNLVYSPQRQKIDTLIAEKTKYDEQLTLISKEALNLQNIKKNTKIINANILGLSEDLLPPIAEEKLILIMDDLINKSKLNISGFTISNPALESVEAVNTIALEKQKSSLGIIVDEYNALNNGEEKINKEDTAKAENKDLENDKDKSKDTENKEASKEKDTTGSKEGEQVLGTTVEKVSISMGYQGTYEELNSFIKAVEDFPKKIIINNLAISASEDKVTGNLTLDFYFIPKINTEEEYMPWMYKSEYGKENPFKAIGATGNTNSGSNLETDKNYDFNMTVKPTSSDLPTVVLGKSKDTNRSTYVYGDNDGVEEVKIDFVESAGKYFFKYKTSSSVYPKSNDIGQEFLPTGDSINLIIYSTKRNSEEDLSGVNLKISNETNKKVFVKILGDDKARPRVNIISEKGEVNQER